jgi:hypothetical protein
VAIVGAHFDASEDGEIVLGAEFFDGLVIPDGVVLREDDGIEPGRFGASDEVIGVKDAIVGAGPSVTVKVY